MPQEKFESEYRKIRFKYEQLWSESRDMIFVCNSEYQILEMNPMMRQVFGYNPDDDISVKQMFEKDNDFIEFNHRVYLKEHIDLFEVNFKASNDEIITCLINFFEFVNEDGIETFMGILRNITNRKKVEKNMILAEKLAVSGKIARNIAHEVRNPLTNLNLALDQLKDELNDKDDVQLYLEIIERNSHRIEQLISDLLDSSKPKNYSFQNLDVIAIIREAVKSSEDRLKLQEINLILNLPKNPILRKADRSALNVVFLNLIINAVEAMKRGQGELKILAFEKEDALYIEFHDNGHGIDETALSHIFEPFFSKKQEGNGLGLTNVQNIVHGHGGNIDVSSSNDGTTFTIRL